MSDRRKARINKTKGKPGKFGILKIIIPLLVVAVALLFFKLDTKYWNGHDKVSLVSPDREGNVQIVVLDPALTEETTLTIPGETQVTVARGYGTLRLKNVWQLGINEKLNGALLAQTVTQNFDFPTTLWSSTPLSDRLKFVFSPGKTNIPISDRILMTLFSVKVKSIDKTNIDLGKSQFLKKQNLTDGVPGYVLSGPVSGRLTVYFSDNTFAKKSVKGKDLRFSLTDFTGRPGVADGVGGILEVLGGKVVVIDRQKPDANLDCEVFGKDADAVNKAAVLFSCKKTGTQSDFDVELKLGQKFAKRY